MKVKDGKRKKLRRRRLAEVGLVFYVDAAGKHRWRLVAPNGEVTHASTQGYARLVDARRNAERVLAPAA